jgi:hypothetical protein
MDASVLARVLLVCKVGSAVAGSCVAHQPQQPRHAQRPPRPGRDQIWLHHENHQTIQGAIKALKKSLAAAEQKTYFVTNSRYLIAPVVFSALVVVVYLAALGGSQIVAGTFLAFWLSVWTFAVAGLLRNVFSSRIVACSARKLRRRKKLSESVKDFSQSSLRFRSCLGNFSACFSF